MGGTGNLPVLPGYQPGVRAWVSLLAPDDFVSTGCPSHYGRQVAEQNRLVACSTHPEETGMKYCGQGRCQSPVIQPRRDP